MKKISTQNLTLLIAPNFKWKIFSNFVTFSEYPNFTLKVKGWKKHHRWIHLNFGSWSASHSVWLRLCSKIYHGEQHVTPNMGNQIHLAINYNHSWKMTCSLDENLGMLNQTCFCTLIKVHRAIAKHKYVTENK